jgi:predicted MFS family arabinose efflux permease
MTEPFLDQVTTLILVIWNLNRRRKRAFLVAGCCFTFSILCIFIGYRHDSLAIVRLQNIFTGIA